MNPRRSNKPLDRRSETTKPTAMIHNGSRSSENACEDSSSEDSSHTFRAGKASDSSDFGKPSSPRTSVPKLTTHLNSVDSVNMDSILKNLPQPHQRDLTCISTTIPKEKAREFRKALKRRRISVSKFFQVCIELFLKEDKSR